MNYLVDDEAWYPWDEAKRDWVAEASERENAYCAVCERHGGHSLSCATLNVDGSVINGNPPPRVAR